MEVWRANFIGLDPKQIEYLAEKHAILGFMRKLEKIELGVWDPELLEKAEAQAEIKGANMDALGLVLESRVRELRSEGKMKPAEELQPIAESLVKQNEETQRQTFSDFKESVNNPLATITNQD